MTEPISITVSSGFAISAKSTSTTPGDHVAVLIWLPTAVRITPALT